MENIINLSNQQVIASSTTAPKLAFITAATAILLMLVLHVLSPEFSPSWRMVCEYALGQSAWVLSLMFISWAVSSWTLFFALKPHVKTRAGKVGVAILVVVGVGQFMASIFSVKDEAMHGVAGLLGLPTLPVAALLITYSLKRTYSLKSSKRLIRLAHLTWIVFILLAVSVMIFINGLQNAGVKQGTPITELPNGVISFHGWINRALIIVYCLWTITAAQEAIRLRRQPHP